MKLANITIDKLTPDNIEDALVSAFQAVIDNGVFGKANGTCAYRVYEGKKPYACCVVGALMLDEFVEQNQWINTNTGIHDLAETAYPDLPRKIVGILRAAQGVHDDAAGISVVPAVDALKTALRDNRLDYHDTEVELMERVLNRLQGSQP